MSRRPLRIATTPQFERPARVAGFDVYPLPTLPTTDFNRSLEQRIADGAVYRPFLEENDIELVVDVNTEALTLVPSQSHPQQYSLATADLGIPHVAHYTDPVTATMAQVPWANRWHLLESPTWIKWVWDSGHAEELQRLGIPNVIAMPMAIPDGDFDTSPLPDPDPGPVVAFMGHPATSWFRSAQPVLPAHLQAGLIAAAVNSGMPDMLFHRIFFDLYQLGEAPGPHHDGATRAALSENYFGQKFTYNAYLAVKQRDRFVRFLKHKLGDNFELIGDHWGAHYGLNHTPRVWDMRVLHRRMRTVPICLNLLKGNLETGVVLRHFEVTSQGGFMLTYATPELSTCFEIGTECDVFTNEAELLDKIDHYLHHPQQRRDIAAAGQRRTLSEHLYSHRLTRLVDILRSSGALPRTQADTPTPCEASTL